MVAPGSESGISFNLNPECSPIDGGLHVTSAFSPVSELQRRFFEDFLNGTIKNLLLRGGLCKESNIEGEGSVKNLSLRWH